MTDTPTLDDLNGAVDKLQAIVPPQGISPMPWVLVSFSDDVAVNIVDAEGYAIAEDVVIPNAELILKAVKFHNRLVAALRHMTGAQRNALDVLDARELIAEVMSYEPEYVE